MYAVTLCWICEDGKMLALVRVPGVFGHHTSQPCSDHPFYHGLWPVAVTLFGLA